MCPPSEDQESEPVIAARQATAGQASRSPWGPEGATPQDATFSRGSTGVLAVACLHKEIRRNTGSLDGGGA